MKTFNSIILMIALVAGMSLMTSCKKDNEMLLPEDIVGVWDVKGGEAIVSNNADINDSYKIKTDGTITLNADGTGVDNLTISFMDNTDVLTESYNWELAGNQLTIRTPSLTVQWEVVKTKKGMDIIQREQMPGHADLEIELTLFLRD